MGHWGVMNLMLLLGKNTSSGKVTLAGADGHDLSHSVQGYSSLRLNSAHHRGRDGWTTTSSSAGAEGSPSLSTPASYGISHIYTESLGYDP
jgi:hypothetical protein